MEMIPFGSLSTLPTETTYTLFNDMHAVGVGEGGGLSLSSPLHSCTHLPSNTWAWDCLCTPPVKEHTTRPRVHGDASLGAYKAMSP